MGLDSIRRMTETSIWQEREGIVELEFFIPGIEPDRR